MSAYGESLSLGLPADIAAKNVIADFRAGIITAEQAVDDIRRIRKEAAMSRTTFFGPEDPQKIKITCEPVMEESE